MRIVAAIIAGAVALGVVPSFAAALPDATYRCEMYSGTMIMHLGDIAISGNTYQGPAWDGNYEGTYDYELTEGGTINWGGPMGGFSSGGNTIVSTALVRNGEDLAFDITMQLESGNFSTVSCFRE